jgi:allantoin racemase
MKLDIIIPVSTDIWNEDVKNACLKIASPDTEIRITEIKRGPESIESEYDEVFSSPHVVKTAEELAKSGSEGIIIYCFGEPGLHAAKEKLSIPVVGIKEAAISMAKILGDNIGLISPLKTAVPGQMRVLKNEVRKIVSIDMPVLDFINTKTLEEKIENKVKELVLDGCDVVVLGCGSMLNIDFERMQKEYGVPIIIPLNAAIGICEYLIKNNLTQSKLAYPFPPEKTIK